MQTGMLRGELRDFRKATAMSFNALRQDMNDGFRRVDERFEAINGKSALIDGGFAEMCATFDTIAAGQQHIVELIQTVIDSQGDSSSA